MTFEPDTVQWRGVHHLALVTTDMDATVRFYAGVLDARLVATIATDSFKHYFFDFGTGSTIAFFEYKGQAVETFSKPAGVPFPLASQFDHLSIHLVDEDALLRLRDRLKTHGCEVTDVVDHGFLRSIYFNDNNGIALEASWWVLDATARPADYGDARLFGDPAPVPALAEIASADGLRSTPRTRLSGSELADPV